ncbi:hypothetical protein QCA50_002917 [Cerrena zonata]|uniref:Uncharacterized protein n=1 Tax=Cerrena zonata TaxID=2478898 RepID=A0AAW0GQL9_9APHY
MNNCVLLYTLHADFTSLRPACFELVQSDPPSGIDTEFRGRHKVPPDSGPSSHTADDVIRADLLGAVRANISFIPMPMGSERTRGASEIVSHSSQLVFGFAIKILCGV